MPLLEGLDGVDKMSKSKNNYIGISEDANTMFAKVLSISDELMWRWYTLLSFQSMPAIEALKREVAGGRNPKEAKVALAKEITARFHSQAAAEAAEQDFVNRSKGGVPDEIPEVSLSGAPMGITALLKSAGLAPSTSEAGRLIDGGGVRVDSSVVSDKGSSWTQAPMWCRSASANLPVSLWAERATTGPHSTRSAVTIGACV
jgi:tyrosyl-tRNA synthetase